MYKPPRIILKSGKLRKPHMSPHRKRRAVTRHVDVMILINNKVDDIGKLSDENRRVLSNIIYYLEKNPR